ncbi:MAG: hypothetical protein EA369_00175 [Bradymonadales bacterium]|nr:MAG: hypothetical protein EA369_00175 [Bradymonadales bacterium]
MVELNQIVESLLFMIACGIGGIGRAHGEPTYKGASANFASCWNMERLKELGLFTTSPSRRGVPTQLRSDTDQIQVLIAV